MFKAAREGNVGDLEAAINSATEAQADLEERDAHSGQAALHLAAAAGSVACVEKLLAPPANAKLRAHDGKTALHLAAAAGSKTCLAALLEASQRTDAGLHVDNGDDCSMTALHLAAQHGHDDCVEYLLEQGASFSVAGKASRDQPANQTPLRLAAAAGHVACVQFLLDNGAIVRDATSSESAALVLEGKTALELARSALQQARSQNQPVESLETTIDLLQKWQDKLMSRKQGEMTCKACSTFAATSRRVNDAMKAPCTCDMHDLVSHG